MYDALCNLLESGKFTVVERFELPSRPATYGNVPGYLSGSVVGEELFRRFQSDSGDDRLWAHQTQALEALGSGENVVVATGTASGKSLVFRSHAFHTTLLDANRRTLVFYPLKALAADQVLGWKEMARSLQVEDDVIGRIDGSVHVSDREQILRNSKIVVMTPDVCHAWLMHRLSLPVVRDFVRSLSLVVMDEAHTLEGVFGSNFAFLIRRLIAARRHLLQDKSDGSPLQFVAATATIQNPGEHLEKLTGYEFTAIEDDGAPQYGRIVAHIACPLGEETRLTKTLHEHVLNNGQRGGFITFVDSRKGVEGLAMASGEGSNGTELDQMLGAADVLPYRAGYDSADREKIEQRLRSGDLKGVVSTSALELGLDIPHLCVGFNVGVPSTRKAYRQRLGRIGRSGRGAFVVIAPPQAFRAYGTSFRQYHEMSVEPSYLYLDNRFMQFAHGRCLAVEQESLGVPLRVPGQVSWPEGFTDIYTAAKPAGGRPPEYDAIAALGGDTPHYGYPLRNVGEVSFQLKTHTGAESFGDVNQLQALRECYPGGTYLHLTKAYEVAAWHTNSFESFIRVKPSSPGRWTKPKITTWVNAGMTSADILDGHMLKGEGGFLAECLMQVTQRVEGFVEGATGEFRSYKELQQQNPNMRARSRNFRTSGVILFVDSVWFKKSQVKEDFAKRLLDVFIREYSISPQDVGFAASNISLRTLDGGGPKGGCIAIFDEIYGSLRLTERLYVDFNHVLERLLAACAVDQGGDEDGRHRGFGTVVEGVQAQVRTFDDYGGWRVTGTPTPAGHERVFRPGSRVCYREAGPMMVDVEIIQPTMMDGQLMYQVKTTQRSGQSPAKLWVNASALEPSADASAWDYGWWNRQTEDYEDPHEVDEC